MSQPRDHRERIRLDAEAALASVANAAELWGAKWHRLGSGGQIELPVHAGVRRGIVRGRLWTEPARRGTDLIFRVESSEYHLKRGAVSILAVGGVGALALTLWPLYPPLLAVAPLALVFSIGAWLVIASRLQSAGVEDFFKLVASGGESGEAGSRRDQATGR